MATAGNDLPIVSVIIPTHNRACVVQESIASVRAQEGRGTIFEMEIVVVDDASTDTTPEVMERYPDIKYVRLPVNRGLPAARNEGIKASTGKYIAFNDDDDLWLPYKLSLLVPALESDPQLSATYAQMIVNCENNIALIPDSNAPSGNLFPMLLMKDCQVGILGIMVRREVFDVVGYFDETLKTYEDIDWVLRVAARYRLLFRPGPVALYRLSKKGKYVTDIIEGRTESTLRTIVENALKLLPPDSEDYKRLRQEAFARLELKVAEELEWVEEYDRMKTHLEAAIKEYPSVTREPAVRALIQRQVCHLLRSRSPVAVVREITAKLRTFKPNGLSASFSARSLSADIWGAVAYRLARRDDGARNEAWLAAIYAVFANPFMITSPTILKIFMNRMLGRRASSAVADLTRRMF
jgi:glycosyltransferase involved in cell wall biosynthesis